MFSFRRQAIITLVLSLLLIIAIIPAHLALTDIHHGIEPDLSLEWSMVRLTFLLLGTLILSAGILAIRVLKLR